jgi:hypothetical protein
LSGFQELDKEKKPLMATCPAPSEAGVPLRPEAEGGGPTARNAASPVVHIAASLVGVLSDKLTTVAVIAVNTAIAVISRSCLSDFLSPARYTCLPSSVKIVSQRASFETRRKPRKIRALQVSKI